MQKSMLYARKDEYSNYQALSEHLNNVADLSVCFARRYRNLAKLSGVFHDVGKATKQFQDNLSAVNLIRGSIVHSLQGAFCISESSHETQSEILSQELLELIIAGHHGGLADCVDLTGDRIFFDKMLEKDDEKYRYDEVKRNLNCSDVSSLYNNCSTEIQNLLSIIKQSGFNKESANFALGLFVKYMYSCLIDADRLDAYLFDAKEAYAPNYMDWEPLINVFENAISNYDNTSEINKIRAEISDKCKNASKRETGIYRLSVPTGGGKTLSSLRFALHHAMESRKNRIIYVIPYLSITTQTVHTICDILNLNVDSEILLEHHSSVVAPETGEENDRSKFATARWDNPIIVTTMVQFLETVMSARGSDLRKFHNMEDSVIIFDEIQSLPINCIHLFNEIVSFLSKILNTTILLCTATQPLIDKTGRKNLLLSDNPDIIGDYKHYEEKFKRTNIVACNDEKTIGDFAQIVFKKAEENGSCLTIVNLKSEARDIYTAIKLIDTNNEFELVHLSTSMCGEHRKNALNKLKKLLVDNKKVICVSTQLIEAGVDISFACVVRAMAGIDSILQAAGRCNRNGESAESKDVYVFPIKDEKGLDKLTDIKQGKAVTERIIRENPNAEYLSKEILDKFYLYYFFKRQNEMDYITEYGTVYDMLSCNIKGKENYKNRTGQNYNHYLAQAFTTASDNFSVISNLTRSVVVYYKEAEELLDSLKTSDLVEKIRIIRKLQSYLVSLFEHEYIDLSNKRAITLFDDDFGIYVLNQEYYSDEYGIVKEAEMQNLVV